MPGELYHQGATLTQSQAPSTSGRRVLFVCSCGHYTWLPRTRMGALRRCPECRKQVEW